MYFLKNILLKAKQLIRYLINLGAYSGFFLIKKLDMVLLSYESKLFYENWVISYNRGIYKFKG